jgi:TP901 family phage tail tape measure protein
MDEIKQNLGFDASQALKTLGQLDSAMAQFEKRLASSASALSAFNIQGLAIQKFGRTATTELTEVVKHTDRMTTSLKLMSRIVFTQAIVRGLSQLRNAFRASAGDAIAFQKQIALITTIDDSAQSAEQLAGNVRSVSEQFNIPLLETAAGLYQTISNQIGNAAQSQEFLAKSAQFARATGSDLANSVDLLSGALKSYGLDVSETDRVSSIFFKTIDLGRVEANELANSFGRVGPIAAELGISLEETGAALAAITVRGSKTSEALTQVRGIASALQKPTVEMTKALRDAGFTSAETAIKTLGLSGVLALLAKSTDGSAEAMAKLFPNVRALGGVATLTSDGLKSISSAIDEMTTASANFTSQKFGQATATDAEKLTAEINKLKNAFTVDLGFAIVKSGVQLADWTGGADNIVAAAKAAGPVIIGLGAAFGVAKLEIAAARFELGFLSKGLGALSLASLAVGFGTSLGQFIDSEQTKRRGEVLKALESQHAAELKLVEAKLKKQRDLENAADADLIKAKRQTFAALNRLYIVDFDNAKSASDALVANVESAGSKILSVREKFVDELARAGARADDIIKASSKRVVGLQDLKDDRKFDKRTSNLDDAQKAILLGRRAQELAATATKQLNRSGLLGDTEGIARALQLFDKAATTGESSRAIAERIGNRNLENRAIQIAANLTDQQITAEQKLTLAQATRQRALDNERARQQKITDEIRKQTKIAADNTGLFNSSGQEFSAADQAKRAAARANALKNIANAALSQSDLSAAGALGVADFVSRFNAELSRDPVRLALDTQNATDQIRRSLENAFSTFKLGSGVDVGGLERVLGRTLTTPDAIGQALDEVSKKAADLRTQIDAALTLSPQAKAFGEEIDAIVAGLDERSSERGRQAKFSDQSGLLNQFNQLRAGMLALRNDSTLTQDELNKLIAARNAFGQAALKGGIVDFGRLTFGGDIVEFDKALVKLQQLSNLPQPDISAQQSQLQQLEAVLRSNPAGQFQTAATAIGSAVSPSERIANAWERAAAASQRVGIGAPQGFATGGFARGTDTIPAMLTAGESVINAKSSRRFFSQIQAMNAGHAPVFRQDGGSVDNSVHVGDVSVSGGDAIKVRELVKEINRSTRRGASRIK